MEIGRFRRRTVQVGEALERLLSHARPGDVEEVTLDEAYGRRFAGELVADYPYPHFRRSGMDGYAIVAADTAEAASNHPVLLEVIDNIPCGAVPLREVRSGCASRIMTGAMLPEGADAVIMLEMTEEHAEGERPIIAVKRRIELGANVSPVGSEIEAGRLLIERGRLLAAGEITLLATYGWAKVPVYRRPVVAILSTGSELLDVDQPLAPGKIRDSNTAMLAALVREEGALPLIIGTVRDDTIAVEAIVERMLAKADAAITTGGVSVGDYDVMVDVFAKWNGTMLFNKVAMRPGSPTTAGVLQDKLLFSLSGNPGACFVGFKLFVRPVLSVLQGAMPGEGGLPTETAVLGEDYPKLNAYPRYLRGRRRIGCGIVNVVPLDNNQSGAMVSIQDADCLIVIPPGGNGLPAGEVVDVVNLR
jgi:molybdopterin molybdotransferase